MSLSKALVKGPGSVRTVGSKQVLLRFRVSDSQWAVCIPGSVTFPGSLPVEPGWIRPALLADGQTIAIDLRLRTGVTNQSRSERPTFNVKASSER